MVLEYFQIFSIFDILNQFETISIGCMEYKYWMFGRFKKKTKHVKKKRVVYIIKRNV